MERVVALLSVGGNNSEEIKMRGSEGVLNLFCTAFRIILRVEEGSRGDRRFYVRIARRNRNILSINSIGTAIVDKNKETL